MKLSKLLAEVVTSASPRLAAITSEVATNKPSVDRWAPIEILGHLIDSACNNHIRFVKALQQDSLVFPGYQQLHWVNSQNYQQANWTITQELWKHYNLHLAHFIKQIPATELWRSRAEHNFANMTHGYIADADPDSLGHLIKDYIAHQEHHLQQILPDYQAVVKGN